LADRHPYVLNVISHEAGFLAETFRALLGGSAGNLAWLSQGYAFDLPFTGDAAAVLEMERTLGTRVKVQGDEKRGRIEISYYSAEDLNRIYEWIVKRQ
jgi:hypothetical protein